MLPKFLKLNGDKCPLCSGNNLKNIKVEASDVISKDSSIQIIECIDCSFAWQWPIRRNKNESAQIFHKAYKNKREGSYFDPKNRIDVANLQIKFLEKSFEKGNKNLLDIGSGDGTFIKVAAQNGWHAIGIDPANTEFSFDNSSCSGSANMLSGDVAEFNSEKKFDIITIWDVIEHVDDPIELIQCASKLIKNGGHLIIETGNYQSADRIVGKNLWWGYQFDHRWYFSPPVLKGILQKLDFSNITISTKTLRPHWNPNAYYISPLLFKTSKDMIKEPLRMISLIKTYSELKKAYKKWPQWIKNGIIVISAKYN